MIGRLQQLCEGLVYISDTDQPVIAFEHRRSVLTFQFPSKKSEFETLIDNQIRMDKNWQPLKDYMTFNLQDLTVIKVYKSESIVDVYAVGTYDGGVYGFHTRGVET